MSSRIPGKRLLSIGINDYPLWPPERQLKGCVNDVMLMRQILREQFGFEEEHMTLLTDGAATREAILNAFDALVEATGPDDIVVVHYAGHGSQMTDMEGDEPSGRDSTMVPHDSAGWKGQNRDIKDDEIEKKLDALGTKTSFITLIFDCCHSGTITRDVEGPRSRSLPPDTRPKEELLAFRLPVEGTIRKVAGPSGWLPITEKYVMIAGCRDDETSYEYTTPEHEGKVQHGALTYFLGQELRRVVPGSTYRDVFERAAARVSGYAAAQHPQMEGKADREVLGVQDIEPMRFVRVAQRDGDMVTLAAGAAHGMTIGSTFSVHAQGTKQASDASRLGEVEIVNVGAVTSEARITSESVAGSIGIDARAVEAAHAHGDYRLPIKVIADAEAGAALRRAIEASRLLQLVESGPAVTAELLPARDRVSPGDPVPNAGVLRTPTWAVTSETGAFLMPLKDSQAVEEVRKNLEGTARYRRALDFENANPDSVLAGRFELQLMRWNESGDPTPAAPDPESGHVIYAQDEPVVFRIKSHHDQPVFISLLDFGLTGSVSLVLPWREARSQRKLGPGIGFFYEISKDKLFYARWPKNFPFVEGEDPALEGQAVETVKLFVTEQEADFSLLQQAGTRGGPNETPLGALFNGVFQGHATRDLGRNEPADGDWTTVKQSFVVRRRTTQALTGDETEIKLGNATLKTPGLNGTASTSFGTNGRREAAELLSDGLRSALSASSMEERQTLEIAGAREAESTRGVEEASNMELSLNAPPDGFGQVVMSVDEAGVVSWHIAETGDATRGQSGTTAKTRKYRVPQAVPLLQPTGTRGPLGVLGKKVLKEILFPLIDPIAGEIGAMFVNTLEKKRWPYRARLFQPDDFASEQARNVTNEEWKRLSGGRALLFIHGTFSRAHLAFGHLPVDYLAEFHQRYGGRVFAFDHFTLSHDPRENVRQLLAMMPEGVDLDIDIICHSRGGLVSRILSERLSEFNLTPRRVRVGRVVFVGSPNAGTPLADPRRIGDLLDIFTNVLDFLPDAGVSDVLTMILGVVKQMAVGTLGALDGLQSMYALGDFTKQLNAGSRSGDTKYFAVASNATPTEPGLMHLITTKGLNKFMGGANDLVVPTDGVFRENGSAFFPIEDRLVLEGTSGVTHTRYFESDTVRRKILEWLT